MNKSVNAAAHFLRKVVLPALCLVLLPLGASAQNIRLNYQNTPLVTVLGAIQNQSGYKFVYNNSLVDVNQRVTVQTEGEKIEVVLDKVFKGTGIAWKIIDKQIALSQTSSGNQNGQGHVATVRGRITDADGQPLPGAAVQNLTEKTFAVTDVNGNYELAVKDPAGAKLEISFLGMDTVIEPLNGRSRFDVQMTSSKLILDEVVVTGYQTISKERATGSYSILNAEALATRPTSNLATALSGLVTGMAAQPTGVEGQTRFVIRGQGTLQSGQIERDPLIVVDGFPINGYDGDGTGSLSDIKDPMSTINPNDIESVTVLKDAAATSIYGARAANGVIVITTKKAKLSTRLNIAFEARTTIQSRPDLDYAFNMASAESAFRYAELMQKYDPISVSPSLNPYLMPSASKVWMFDPYSMLFEKDGLGNMTQAEYDAKKQQLIQYAGKEYWKKDLQQYMFRPAVKQNYNLLLRGASEKLNYGFSASYDNDQSYKIGSGNERLLLNLTSTAMLTRKLSFSLNINTVFAKRSDNGISVGELKSYVSPWTRLTDDSGSFVHVPGNNTVYYPVLMSMYDGKVPADWTYNPAVDRDYQDIYANNFNYRIQGGLDYKTDWGLTLSAKGQYEMRRFDSHAYYDSRSYMVRDYTNMYSKKNAATGLYESYFPTGAILRDSGDRYAGYNLRGQADYKKAFGKHFITALAGTEIISSTTNNVPTVYRYGFNPNTYSVQSTADYVTKYENIFGVSSLMPYQGLGSMARYEERYFSGYFNVSYTYDDRISLTGSFRTDATNYQAEQMRDKFSPFWSVGASWILSKEPFMRPATWIDQMKVRASVGVAGVSAGKRGNSSVTTLRVYPGNMTYSNNEPYSIIALRGNPTLTWEKSRTVNAGVDFSFFTGRLFGSVDYYNRFSYDVLARATVPVISQGSPTATYNNAEISNNGVEVSLGTRTRLAKDFWWSGMLNFSYNRNRVVKYNVTSQSPTQELDFLQGYPLNSIAVLRPKGYTESGQIILAGKDGVDEIVTNTTTAHYQDQIERQNGKTLDDLNYTYYLGSTTPTTEVGFTNSFSWKGLTLSVVMTGRFGYWFYRGDRFDAYSTNQPSFSKHLEGSLKVYDEGYASQKEYSYFPIYNDANFTAFNAQSAYLHMYNSQKMYDTLWERGDHIRLQEIYLGYALPDRWMDAQTVFSNVTFYAQASHLGFVWKSCKDMDPDYPIGSVRPMTGLTFGLKVNFK